MTVFEPSWIPLAGFSTSSRVITSWSPSFDFFVFESLPSSGGSKPAGVASRLRRVGSLATPPTPFRNHFELCGSLNAPEAQLLLSSGVRTAKTVWSYMFMYQVLSLMIDV